VIAGDPGSREAAPLVNVPASLVGAGALTFLAYGATAPVVALVPTTTGRLIPLGVATLLIGFFAMAVRRKAASQIVGLLLVDNGIALVAFLATSGVPLVVELGASLDVLLLVVVLRVLAAQMGSKFAVLDLDQLRDLHD
jgi:hydrogenase-4 component E